MSKIELLAPAGSYDAFIAAVQNGADAVYLGGKVFNARKLANNFDDEKLKEVIEYAHIRGVKVYLTLNTLITNNEISELPEFLKYICSIGIDGVIVQDLGVAKFIKIAFPQLKLHASTQMTIVNEYGVKQLEELGFERVVLARELTLNEISNIAKNTSLEVEIFVHGALCVAYSGQCLMSSMIGGRSGNRGMCAQPCRLPYQLIANANMKQTGKHLLSPKDLYSIYNIGDIIESGVKSLKIEGRMKRPEYVATVVRIYRKYIDQYLKDRKVKIEENDIEELTQIFNRGGFTKGYFYGKIGKDMMAYEKPSNWGVYLGKVEKVDKQKKMLQINLKSTLQKGDGIEFWNNSFDGMKVNNILLNGKQADKASKNDVVWLKFDKSIEVGTSIYKTSSVELLEKAENSYRKENRKIKLNSKVSIKLNKTMSIDLKDIDGNKVSIQGEVVAESAINRPLDIDRLREQILKLGNTPFEIENLDIDLDENVSLPISEINNIRRIAIEKMIDLRKELENCSVDDNLVKESLNTLLKKENISQHSQKLSVYYSNLNNFKINNKVDRYYIPITEYLSNKIDTLKIINQIKESKREAFIALPRILRGNLIHSINSALNDLTNQIDGIMTTGIGQSSKLVNNNLPCVGDFSYNVFNSISTKMLEELNINEVTLSPELNIPQIKDLIASCHIKSEVIVYGRLPLMISEYCPVGSVIGERCENKACKADCSKSYELLDRLGNKFPIVTDKITCQSQILNTKKLFLGEQLENVIKAMPDFLRINITIENEEEINDIINFHRDFIDNGSKITKNYSQFIEKMKGDFTKGHYFRGVE